MNPDEADFAALALAPELAAVVRELGFERPTPIQARSIPLLLAGKDVVGQAKTGSGKTAAFALPILQQLVVGQRRLRALVLCPTRELAAQVARELRKLGKNLPGLSVLVVTGGAPARQQALALERGVHVVVGTPGRVLDHLQQRTLKPHQVSTVVLDEADRMLDMGFGQDVTKILRALPKERQTVFFSATFPDSIRDLSAKHQTDPVTIGIGDTSEAPVEIDELVMHVLPELKLEALRAVLAQHAHDSALVFANLKSSVAEIVRGLGKSGTSVESLHGDLEQSDRDRVLAKFRNGSTRVLIATDVAARGIDLEKLDLVVNYEIPKQAEVYVHRVGRTGRAGHPGLAVAMCSPEEQHRLVSIERYTGKPLRRVEPSLPQPTGRGGAAKAPEAKMETLWLSGGRKDKLRPGDILGALTGETGGLDASSIGKIEIHDRFAYVAIDKRVSAKAFDSLSEGKIKGRRFLVERVK